LSLDASVNPELLGQEYGNTLGPVPIRAAQPPGALLSPPTSHAGELTRRRRWPLVAILAIGLGLALAPVGFEMFSRAPAGGDMLDDFEPFMDDQRLDRFTTDLATIRAARDEAATFDLDPTQHPQAAVFVEQYPAIHDDMSSMLADIRSSIPDYQGMAALPPFSLFPLFFLIPGLLLASVAVWALVAAGGTPLGRARTAAFVALGVGLIAAPVVFQMFTRAPGGAEMIDSFKPLMQRERVTEIQRYFLVIGSGEADLRNDVVPEVEAEGGTAAASRTLSDEWPAISSGMAPMIGAMADNLEAFDGIAALPPFGLFPWFFVAPGVLVLVLTAAARRPRAIPEPVSPPARTERALEGA
jgi:hypothetical protein